MPNNYPPPSRALLPSLPLSFSTPIHLHFHQPRTLTLRGPAILISKPTPTPSHPPKLLLLSPTTRPHPLGKHRVALAGTTISFPDRPTRNAFLTAANNAISRTSTGIHKYAICRKLGHGASGVVYLVRRRADGKRFAMKTIPKTDAFFSDLRLEYLISERTALAEAAQRHSPFIVRLVDVFETERRLCFVMQLAECGDLKGVLKQIRGGRVSERVARMLFAEVLLGVEECHRMGFLMRDIKLGNLLMNARGHVKLADFGLVKRLEVEYEGSGRGSASSGEIGDDGFRLVGRTRSLVGTRRYMSPEQLSRERERKWGYGAPADVWALGVTLYVMVTGEYPFGGRVSGRNNAALFYAISNEELEFPDWVGGDLRELIGGMLERDVQKRIELREIKAHRWFREVVWGEVRDRAERDLPQEEVLEGLRENGFKYGGEEDDEEGVCLIDECGNGSSVSYGSSSSHSRGRRRTGWLKNTDLVGFNYINWRPQ